MSGGPFILILGLYLFEIENRDTALQAYEDALAAVSRGGDVVRLPEETGHTDVWIPPTCNVALISG